MGEHKRRDTENSRYILYRRLADGFNEVIEAGPKAPSIIGLVNFRAFIEKHGIDPREVIQFLKIPYSDMDKLLNHDSWIETNAQENLKVLAKAPVQVRQYICRFLMDQDGKAGSRNVYHKPTDVTKDLK